MGSVGILLIAMGHENYIKMAVNLAASLRYNAPNISIHLVHDGGYDALSDQEKSLFSTNEVPVDQVWHTNGKVDYIKPKTRMYELSPYTKTLYLDVDTIWLIDRSLDQLLSELSNVPFAIMNEGPTEKCYWADPSEIRASTNSEHPMYVFYSELLYFEKSPELKNYFLLVKKAFDKPIVKTRTFSGSAMPDELAFIIASHKTGILPHRNDWLPVYWYFRDKKMRHLQPYQLPSHVFAYSIGGNVTPEYAKAHYNNLVSHYSSKMGIKKPYQVRDKRSYIPERTKY